MRGFVVMGAAMAVWDSARDVEKHVPLNVVDALEIVVHHAQYIVAQDVMISA